MAGLRPRVSGDGRSRRRSEAGLAASVAAVDSSYGRLFGRYVRKVFLWVLVTSPALVLVREGERRCHRQRQNCNCDRFHFGLSCVWPPWQADFDVFNVRLDIAKFYPPPQLLGLRHDVAGCGLALEICGISACRGRPFDGRPPARGLPMVIRRRGWRGENFQTSGRVIGETAPASTASQGTTAQTSMAGQGRSGAFTGADPSRADVFLSARDLRRMGQGPFPTPRAA